MNGQDYFAYVASAYGLSALALVALGALVWLNGRAKRLELRRLEDQGFRRRSEARAS